MFCSFRYVFVWTTIQIFFFIASGLHKASIADISIESEDLDLMSMVIDSMYNYFTVIFLTTLPIYSLTSYLLFKKPKFNFAEHLVLAAYSFGTISFFGLVVSIVYWSFPPVLQ